MLCVIGGSAFAQSYLPPCPTSGTWNNCFGTHVRPDGVTYVGEYQNDQRHGNGIEYRVNGSISRSGLWSNSTLAKSYSLDANRFALNVNQQVSALQTVTPVNTERVQSSLPPCQGDVSGWTNCFGEKTDANGNKYVGEYKDDKRNGQGISYRANGTVASSGDWSDGNLVNSFAIDTKRFPFNPPEHTVRPSSAETDRLTADAQALRQRQQELEQRLAATAAEAEAVKRRQQELEAQLAAAQSISQTAARPTTSKNERRVALVIGNAAYKNAPLTNPGNDAYDVAATLQSMGFETILVRDATLAQMRGATREFADAAASSEIALIFYAGHGIEAKGRNYVIPVNADIKHEYELEEQAYDASRWLEMLEGLKTRSRQRVNILILDACRNNEFARSWRSSRQGLARMDAPTGTFVAFSTAPGRVALDGAKGQRNSPFTKSLLRAIQTPDVPIELMFKEVRRLVVDETKSAQVPWENSSLVGDFVFRRTK